MTYSLPNFFLVGSAKAGTTALQRCLAAHPQIYMSPIKEPNYFSQPDMRPELFLSNYRHSVRFNLEAYLTGSMQRTIHIADIRKWEDYIRLYRDVYYEIAIGEASNSYLYCPNAAGQIAGKLPKAKILAILRNPIERAWSHYLMNLRLGYTLSLNFIDEFQRDSNQRPHGWGITHNYRDLGMYSGQLERYYSFFPSNQIKIVLYDDYLKSPHSTLTEIFNFLGVDEAINVDPTYKANRAAIPRFRLTTYFLFRSGLASKLKRLIPSSMASRAETPLYKSYNLPTLSLSERSYLKGIYRDEISKVSDLIRRNLRHWMEK